MIFVYHYHGFAQLSDCALTHIDGILRMENLIETMEDYRRAKELICKGQNVDVSKFVIDGLSLISTIED